jgi:hypothetical protein
MSYDLRTPEELYNFSSDCEEACCGCPQYRPWNPIDFDADRNEVSSFEVFMYWRNGFGGDILFKYGYCANLSEEAKATFNRYIIRQAFNIVGKELEPDVLDLSTGQILSMMPIKILTFCQETL